MLVSDLIRFRDDFINKVEKINLDQSFTNMSNLLGSVIDSNPTINVPTVQEKINHALNQFEEIHQQINQVRQPLITLVDDINQAIDVLASESLVKVDNKFFDYYHKIYFTVNEEIDQAVKSRIHQRADWHFPGLQLGCRNSKYTVDLVANDPLYLCDFDMSHIDQLSSQFNEIYNRRLRKYQIFNNDLSQLPQNQFGFVLSWMLFNYTELSMVDLYLKNLIKLLRPGGILMFSYNNGDILDSCRLSEQGGMSWISKRQLVKLSTQIGYEIIDSFDLPNDDTEVKYISWIELKKPGELSTVKRSQAQGLVGRK
jgi:hypothetical protein